MRQAFNARVQGAMLPPGDVVRLQQNANRDRGPEIRAWALLKARLGPRAALFERTGQLMEPSRLWPGTEYLVERNGKVGVVVQGIIQTVICVTATAGEPEGDRLMTILDLIQSDERKLWEMGNCVPHQPPMGMVRDYLGR